MRNRFRGGRAALGPGGNGSTNLRSRTEPVLLKILDHGLEAKTHSTLPDLGRIFWCKKLEAKDEKKIPVFVRLKPVLLAVLWTRLMDPFQWCGARSPGNTRTYLGERRFTPATLLSSFVATTRGPPLTPERTTKSIKSGYRIRPNESLDSGQFSSFNDQ
jgi:hypothetical protein